MKIKSLILCVFLISVIGIGNVSAEDSGFLDLEGHWSQKYVERLCADNIITGYSDGTFAPDREITRAEFSALIVKAFAISTGDDQSFSDVHESDWFCPYIKSAAAEGFIYGDENKFRPLDIISREDAVTVLYRVVKKLSNIEEGYVFFKDERQIEEYSSDAIRALAQQGIVSGVGDKFFAPDDSVTRGQAATLICRMLDYIDVH